LVILQKKVAGVSTQSLSRFVLRARKAVGLKGTVNILITGNAAMRSLNSHFRGKNKATDVLSFPAESAGTPAFAGEIAISADIAAQNSMRLGHALAAEVKILTLHGILHLAGYDHERDNGEMAQKEENLRRELGLPSALIDRTQSTTARSATRRPGASRLRRAKRTA
jgi:probable rRNA maturation factor